VIYLHVGQADLLNKTTGDRVVAYLKDMVHKLTATTKVKICISLIIPLQVISQVKSVISQVNREIVSFISELRRKEGGADWFFTQNNDGLGTFIRRSTGSHGIYWSLLSRFISHSSLRMHSRSNRCC
jgi:hypothetical protein